VVWIYVLWYIDFMRWMRICGCISHTRFYLCERKLFTVTFMVLWLSLAVFTVIISDVAVFQLTGIDDVSYSHVIKICWYTGNTLVPLHLCNDFLNNLSMLVNMHLEKQFMWWVNKTDLIASREWNFVWHFMSLQNLTVALSAVNTMISTGVVSQYTVLVSWTQLSIG
jgi:hypothetical protein